MNKKLHIICFDVPLPANYGGVIDVFYKIKSLHKNGVEIYLHVFQYGRKKQEALEKFCYEVNYYQRKTSFSKALGVVPYIISSRNDDQLIKNMERVEAPILFEGLHSTYVMRKKLFQKRKLLFRPHNIEHRYYKKLWIHESNPFKKIYYWSASIKLKYYESTLKHCDHILPISFNETTYFKNKFGDKVTFLPAFHSNKKLHELTKKGYFALFHGNLEIADNRKAALFLIDVFKSLPYPLVIAGSGNNKKILSRIDQFKNISFISIKEESQLLELLHRAHVNVLFSNNNSGVKLKLINSLYQSRFVIANNEVLQGSELESLCLVANSKKEIMNQVLKIIEKDFKKEEIDLRKKVLSKYNNDKNITTLLELI